MTKEQTIKIRLTSQEKAAAVAAADRDGKTISEVLRVYLQRYAKRNSNGAAPP